MPKVNRKFVHIDCREEFSLAERIMIEIIVPAVNVKPNLNLCLIRQFCEQMFRWEGDYPEEGCISEAPMKRRNY